MIGVRPSIVILRRGRIYGVGSRAKNLRSHQLITAPPAASSFLRGLGLPWTQGHRISTESLPRIAQPSLWKSLVPKPLRSTREESAPTVKPKKKDWNPATFFIAMVMLIGSQAIQMISLRSSFVQFSNQTETKLAKLREVVAAIQRGEEVDVEAILGTGDQTAEREWEQVIRELEREDEVYRRKRKRKEEPDKDSDASDTSTPSYSED